MGRYTGPKGRVNRRLGALVFEDAGATRALDQRNLPPGMSQRRRKASNFGLALIEKQKIKFYYGLRERQLRRYFDKARRIKGNTGEALMILCEQRLDNVVCRAGFAQTRPQARQGIVHAHFQLNGVTVNKPSIWVKAGDVISVRNRPNLKKLYGELVESGRPACAWISLDKKALAANVVTAPSFEDVSLPVDVGQVVALISR
ncbi:MAG: 30S ribosomal protein S4 [Planctomycetaceae bacterium]|nr:30S ribosomal protein S4 [Planctomycetaceae bacterium]